MMRLATLALLGAGACGDPQLDIVLTGTNPSGLSTTCVTSVDTFVYGKTYEQDKGDLKYDCLEIAAGAMTAADVKRAISGKFDIQIPQSGLLGVELEAHNGPCRATSDIITNADLIFNASARFKDGSDQISLPIVPIASCETASIRVRPVDILQLVRTKSCAMSLMADNTASVQLGSMAPTLLDGQFFWSSQSVINVVGGAGTSMGLPNTSSLACLAANAGNQNISSLSCVNLTGPSAPNPPVCATVGEAEVGIIDETPILMSLPRAKLDKWHAAIIGGVFTGSGATLAPVSGATVTLADTSHGEVAYGEPNASDQLIVTDGAAMTGASGMFVVFTDKIQDITVTSGGKSHTYKVGATKDRAAVVLVQM